MGRLKVYEIENGPTACAHCGEQAITVQLTMRELADLLRWAKEDGRDDPIGLRPGGTSSE